MYYIDSDNQKQFKSLALDDIFNPQPMRTLLEQVTEYYLEYKLSGVQMKKVFAIIEALNKRS